MTDTRNMFDSFSACPLTGLPIKGKAAFSPYQGNSKLVLYEFAPISKAVFDFGVLVDIYNSLVAGNHTPSSKLAGLSRVATEKGQAPLYITNSLFNETRGVTETLEEKRNHLLHILYVVDNQEYRTRDIFLHNDFPLAFAKDAEEFSRILEMCVKKGLIQYNKSNDSPNDWPYGMRTHYYGVSLTAAGEKVASELIALPRINTTTMTDEDIVRRQAQVAYSNAIAQSYPFAKAQGVAETRRALIEGLQHHYQKSDKLLYLDEVNKLLNKELTDHKPRCTMKGEPCPLEAGIHEVLYFMKQENNKLNAPTPQPPPLGSQHFHFGEKSTNTVSTGPNAVQTTNTGESAQINVASGQTVTQSISGEQIVRLKDILKELKHIVDTEPRLKEQQEDIADQLQVIEAQLEREKPKTTILLRSVDTLKELAKDGLGSVAGHTIFELLQQVPNLIGAVV